MSVSTSTSSVSYVGNNSTTTAYVVPYVFFDATDLKVYSVDASGVSTLLTLTTQYTVSGGAGSTGSVTTTSAIPATGTIIITRAVPYTQLTSFTTGDRLPAASIEKALDKLTMEAQQLDRKTMPDTASTAGSAPYVLGLSAAGGTPTWTSQSSASIADGSITPAKLSAGKPTWDTSGNLTATSFIGPVTGNVTGNLTGNVTGNVTGNLTGTASAIPDLIVSTAKVQDSAITTAKIADSAITSAKISTSVIFVPSGAVMAFAMNSAPSGWLAANGAEISRTVYADLFAAIGTTYGVGNGSTTFLLPDLRGYFVRGSGTNADATASGTFGAKQADDFKSHTHSISIAVGSSGAGTGVMVANATAIEAPTARLSAMGNGGTETRPRNIAMLYCIKF